MKSNSFWLADKTISADLKSAYRDAVASNATKIAVENVTAALHLLINESGFYTEIQLAINNSLASGDSVNDVLRKRGIEVLDQVSSAQSQKRLFHESCLARQKEIQPTMGKCAAESTQLHDAITHLEAQIRHFEQNRALSKEKYESAGLTEAQIEQIGISPSPEDLAKWSATIPVKRARIAQINKFYKSAPQYDLSLLDAAPAL